MKKVLLALLLIGIYFALIVWGCSCSCRREQPAIVENDSLYVRIDSLKLEILDKEQHIEVLKTELKKAKRTTAGAKTAGLRTADTLRAALRKRDTVKVYLYATDCEQDFRTYVDAVEQEDVVKSALLEKQDSVIALQKATIDLKTKALTKATLKLIKAVEANDSLSERNDKLERKLKRNKWVLRHAGPVAVVGAAALLLPAYVPVAVLGGGLLYLITKPKKIKP
jgi:hypothetical protein